MGGGLREGEGRGGMEGGGRECEQKGRETATEEYDGRNTGESSSREDLLNVGEQVRQVCGGLELIKFVGTQRDELVGSRRRNSKSAGFVAINFEQFDFQHDFAAGPFELFDEFTCKGQALRRVAHGDGSAASVKSNVRCSGDVAQHAQNLGGILRADGCGERKDLFGFQAILPPLLRRIWSDKHKRGIQGTPKSPRLRAEESHSRGEIHFVNTQVYVSASKVRIKGRFDAEACRHLFIARLGTAAQD